MAAGEVKTTESDAAVVVGPGDAVSFEDDAVVPTLVEAPVQQVVRGGECCLVSRITAMLLGEKFEV